jgi:hypothetical protein
MVESVDGASCDWRLSMKVGDLVRIPKQDNTVALVLEVNPAVAKLKYCCHKRGIQWTPLMFLEMVNESR